MKVTLLRSLDFSCRKLFKQKRTGNHDRFHVSFPLNFELIWENQYELIFVCPGVDDDFRRSSLFLFPKSSQRVRTKNTGVY